MFDEMINDNYSEDENEENFEDEDENNINEPLNDINDQTEIEDGDTTFEGFANKINFFGAPEGLYLVFGCSPRGLPRYVGEPRQNR